MKTMVYDGKLYWMVTGISAVRPHSFDRLEILNLDENGEVRCVSRTTMPTIHSAVTSTFKKAGIA
jgi:hypothetical protein